MKCLQNLLAWQVFVAACRTRSISEAAVLTDIDLPKASRLIAGLEKELGKSLFDKTRRPIQPTAEAEKLRAAIEPLVTGFQEILEPKKEAGGEQIIRFAAPIELAQEYFSEQLFRYSGLFPGVAFAVVPETGPDEVRRGEVDVAVLNRRPADPAGLIIRNYNNSTTVPLATPEYLRRAGIPEKPSDLAKHEGLLLKAYNDEAVTGELFCGKASEPLVWRRTFVTHDQLTLKRLLLEHHGITVDLALLHVEDEIREGRVVPILEGWTRAPRYMCLVDRREEELNNAKLRNFVLWMTATAREDMQKRTVDNFTWLRDAYRRFAEARAAGLV